MLAYLDGSPVTKWDLLIAYKSAVGCKRYAGKLKPMAMVAAAKFVTDDPEMRLALRFPGPHREVQASPELRSQFEAELRKAKYRFPPSGRPGDRAKLVARLHGIVSAMSVSTGAKDGSGASNNARRNGRAS